MLRYQQSQNNEQHGLHKIIGISVALHSVILLVAICGRAKNSGRITIADKDNVIFVVDPLIKRAKTSVKSSLPVISSPKKRTVSPSREKMKTSKGEKKLTVPQSISQKEKTPIQPIVTKKISEQKSVHKGTSLEELRKQKKKKSLTTEKITPETNKLPPQSSSSIQNEGTEPQPEVMHIGREDAQELFSMRAVRVAINKEWRPPQGFKLKNECEIKVEIAQDGVHKKVSIIKSSGVPIYDAAARSAVLKATFPREKWGHSISLIFN